MSSLWLWGIYLTSRALRLNFSSLLPGPLRNEDETWPLEGGWGSLAGLCLPRDSVKGPSEVGACGVTAEQFWGTLLLVWLVGALTPVLPASVWVTCVRMAEQEPTAEQLAQIAAENEEDEHSVNYKPPAQKSIQEIQELDKDDESLRKYKEALLGAVTVSAGEPWDVLIPSGLASAPTWELFSQLCVWAGTQPRAQSCVCAPPCLQRRAQGQRGGGGTLPLRRTVGRARCSGGPDPYRVGGCFCWVSCSFKKFPGRKRSCVGQCQGWVFNSFFSCL